MVNYKRGMERMDREYPNFEILGLKNKKKGYIMLV